MSFMYPDDNLPNGNHPILFPLQSQQHQSENQLNFDLQTNKHMPSSNSQNYTLSNMNAITASNSANNPLSINTQSTLVTSNNELITSVLPLSSSSSAQISQSSPFLSQQSTKLIDSRQIQQQQINQKLIQNQQQYSVQNQQYQQQQQQQQNYVTMPIQQFNSFTNGGSNYSGGNSENSSRTASPAFNLNNKTLISNQRNLNNSNISNINVNNVISTSSANVSLSQQQQLTNASNVNSMVSDVKGGVKIIENSMDNLAITNGFQNNAPITRSNSNINNFPSGYQQRNNQGNCEQQQQQQQDHLRKIDNSLQRNSPVIQNSLMNMNYVPTNTVNHNQQQNISVQATTSAITSMPLTNQTNYNNNTLTNPVSTPISRTVNNINYSQTFNTNAVVNQNQISNTMYKSTMPPHPPPTINQTIQYQQQQKQEFPINKSYPPSASQPLQYQQQQKPQQGHFQPTSMPATSVPPKSMPASQVPPTSISQSCIPAASLPPFVGQQNAGPQKYQSSVPSGQSNIMNYPNVTKHGFNKLWGQDVVDLMQHRHILPYDKVQPPRIVLNNQFYESVNCNPEIIRCTLSKIPDSNSLLQKSRLPLGILVHPFRDINSLPVIQCPNIVRCRLCRTYINPFVYFVDSKMWKCNLCYRVNELPEDFQYDPATKTYGDVTRRPEVRSSTIEFIAPSEYMLRPPQPAVYLFLFDVSILAQQSGYLEIVCATLLKYLDDMPGDARTKVGFIAFNSEIHFYNIAEGYNQPHEMTLIEIDDPFLPRPDNLLVNLKENRDLIKDLLNQLPKRFENTHDPGSALGAALQVAYKLMSATGGRVTVFQTCLPNKGPGALQPREDPNNRSSKDVMHLNPATDFYKRHALECSGCQIAVDLFVLNQQYCDLATISGVSKYSGGSIYHFPLYQKTKPQQVNSLKQCFKRYLIRKIGFEAVMRIRCTRGLQVHTFHGNFFVRSTDLLSLPNINPDAGYGMQISYEESLIDIKTICFQSALLYTNSEGERRIRVHTLCLPVTSNLHEIMHSADSQAIVSLLSKMAVDRSISSSITDVRDAFINATIDIINAFKVAQNLPQGQTGQLFISKSLSLLPLYISALLKHIAFRIGTSTRLDDRISAMDSMKTLPLDQLMKSIYPEHYILDSLFCNLDNATSSETEQNQCVPPLLQLTAEHIDSRSMFLIDSGPLIIIYVGLNVPTNILENVLGVKSTSEIPDFCYELKSFNTPESIALGKFIDSLNEEKPFLPIIQIIRDTSTCRNLYIEKLVDDRSESSLSYYEFLQHLRSQLK